MLLVLSPNQERYKGALYQRDFLDALSAKQSCFFYGPGYPGFNADDRYDDVVAKMPEKPDAILVAHGWLDPGPWPDVSPGPRIELSSVNLPKVAILNKEYLELNRKLHWLRAARVDFVFSHHHRAKQIAARGGLRGIFWPFAVDPNLFYPSEGPKDYVFGFTGIVQNPSFSELQTGFRREVMKELFWSIGDVPLMKRARYASSRIFWRSWTGKPLRDRFNSVISRQVRLNPAQYAKLMRTTSAWLTTLSPMDLIGTRFFECMASGTGVVAERNKVLEGFFPPDSVIYLDDSRQIGEVLTLDHESDPQLNALRQRAFKFVVSHHTWSHRVDALVKKLR